MHADRATSPTGRAATTVLLAALLLAAGAGIFLAVKSAGPSTPAQAGAAAPPAPAKSVDAVLNSARTLIRDGELSKADAVLTAAIAQFPGEQALYVSRAELLTSQQKPADAYAMYEKALAIGPPSGEMEFAAGTVASMAGKLDRAAEHFQAAQQAMKTDHRPPLFLAQVQIKLDRTEEAKANLILAGKLNPDIAVVWGTLADLELRQNRPGLALQHVEKARTLEPRVTLWRLIQARALKRDAKPDEALQVLLGVDDAEKFDPQVLAVMSECYGMLKRPNDAADLYARAADAAGSDPQLCLQAALWLERAGDKPKALTYASRAQMLGAKEADTVVKRLQSP